MERAHQPAFARRVGANVGKSEQELIFQRTAHTGVAGGNNSRLVCRDGGRVDTLRLSELWDDMADAQNLRIYVRQLRQKIEKSAERPQYILNETGIGYRLRAPS
ncbi:MAG: winged helix family transcriptional regulator [Mesorhizobium sp.]|nr:MAG: winged helix family transcriptional regulator [Mesorhizobium sp.]RWJ12008.1 MAG: winged helix family transcriptional regulator [Mesorhizobium sp.]